MVKKCLYLLMIMLCFNTALQAAPGDTTWVQANITDLDGYGGYDARIKFPAPGKTYRSIYMVFTLGKHVCAGSPTYCGDWDYTIQNYVLFPGGETFELGRLISPYANAGAPRTPWTWKQNYIYDVTDYAPVLHDSAVTRIFYSGYSGGFTGNLRFMFIEGTPDREVLGVKRLWNGSFGFGGYVPMDIHFQQMEETAPAFTKSAEMKFTITGHGSDANGCCEFMSHNYMVLLDGRPVANTAIWRDDCGVNELFPQSGTWVYNRANWCPGAIVNSNFHPLPGVLAGNKFNVALQFDRYSGGGSYTTEAQLFYYGSMKKSVDASIDEIIAPSNNDNHYRENPICGSPVIHIKNRGSKDINAIAFQYGLTDSTMVTYNWTGNLKALEETDVTLPELKKLSTSDSGMYKFTAKISAVNGGPDADVMNNSMSTQFVTAPLWPSTFKIVFTPNNEPIAMGSNISETSWIIYDMNNNIVKQRSNAKISTLYSDTVSLPTGCYRLQVYDSSCNGLSWWANPSSITDGSLYVRRNTAMLSNIPLKGYTYSGQYSHDFGCGITQYFSINTPTHEGVNDVTESGIEIMAYPNPAHGTVNIDIYGMQQVSGTIHIIDALGRVVSVDKCDDAHKEINISSFANGVYTILFVNEASGNKLTTRLLIAN